MGSDKQKHIDLEIKKIHTRIKETNKKLQNRFKKIQTDMTSHFDFPLSLEDVERKSHNI